MVVERNTAREYWLITSNKSSRHLIRQKSKKLVKWFKDDLI